MNNLADWIIQGNYIIHLPCDKRPGKGRVYHGLGFCPSCNKYPLEEILFAANLAGLYLNARLQPIR